jgi:hypothetical protein
MPKIFVCYRRDDSAHQAGRLYDSLVRKFGRRAVFKDVDSISLGDDFREILAEQVARCDVLLAVIGDGWLSSASPGGSRRLDDPDDYVRVEIEAALARGIPVIPVLVGHAPLPKPEDLPETLRGLPFRNGISVRRDPDYHGDAERLIRGLSNLAPRTRGKREASPNEFARDVSRWLSVRRRRMWLRMTLAVLVSADAMNQISEISGSVIVYSVAEILQFILVYLLIPIVAVSWSLRITDRAAGSGRFLVLLACASSGMLSQVLICIRLLIISMYIWDIDGKHIAVSTLLVLNWWAPAIDCVICSAILVAIRVRYGPDLGA